MAGPARRARIEDVHELAMNMPHVSVIHGGHGNPVYQAGGKSLIYFRNPRPDATDPDTGERYPDLIVSWAASEAGKPPLHEPGRWNPAGTPTAEASPPPVSRKPTLPACSGRPAHCRRSLNPRGHDEHSDDA